MAKVKKLLIISNGDGMASMSASLLLKSEYEVTGVIFTTTTLKNKLKLLFTAIRSSSIYFAIYVFLESFFSNKIAKNEKILPLKEFVQDNDIENLVCDNINSEIAIKFVKNLQPDVILSIRPSKIFGKKYFDLKIPILNVHCSDLPNYRGMAGILRALAEGEQHIGCSVFQIVPKKIDGGPVVAKRFLKNENPKSLFNTTIEAWRQTPELWLDALENLKKEHYEIENPIIESAQYSSWPGKDKFKKLSEKKIRLFSLDDLKLPTP